MVTMDDLVAQYRDIYYGSGKPLMNKCHELMEGGASREFVDAYYERELGAALRRAGWTRQMYDGFGQIDLLQRVHRLAARHPGRVGVMLGDVAAAPMTEDTAEGARYLFELEDGHTIEVLGGDIPEIRCPIRSEDRDGLDPLPEADEAPSTPFQP